MPSHSSPIHKLVALADAIDASPDPLARRFATALREGGSLEQFGLEFVPWLRRYHVAAAVERRDRAIHELGERIAAHEDRVERRLAEMLRPSSPPLPDAAEEALRRDALAAQAVIHPSQPTPIHAATIRKARQRSGETWRTDGARASP